MSGYKAADSDVRMMIATQVAYLDADEGMTVGDLLDSIIKKYENGDSHLSGQYDTAMYIKETMEKYGAEDCSRWVIKNVSDDNANSGFYGCLLDTRDGDAIVGFRGSESMNNPVQLQKDWIDADFGLLNNRETLQQQKAAEFTQQMYQKYGNQYDGYSFTGHSLGGNLAEHATVTAPNGMPIHRCVSYDGPGFSGEYIADHGSEIAARAKYIDHFQYSVVGALLYPLPGTNFMTIKAHNGSGDNVLMRTIWRHDTHNIEFTSDGSVQKGEQDWLSSILGPISKDIENGAPAIIWALFPQLALLWTIADKGYELFLGMKDLAEKTINDIKTTVGKIRDGIKNWFRNMFGVALTGEYMMNISAITGMASEMEKLSGDLSRLANDILSTASALRYNAISGTLYRSKFTSIGNKVKRDATKARSLAEAARTCARNTQNDDKRAAQCFAAI